MLMILMSLVGTKLYKISTGDENKENNQCGNLVANVYANSIQSSV